MQVQFTKIKNTDTAFATVRKFSFAVMFICAAITGYALHAMLSIAGTAENKIYVLANGKAIEAFASDRATNIPVEARDHVKNFHQYFFTLDPDEQVIETNIKRALYLCDASAKEQYQSLKENGYYANLIAGNVSQKIAVDSVVIQIQNHPYSFRCFARQKIIRPTTITTRSLITEGRLREVERSDHNAHGFLIEKWKIIQNEDRHTETR